MQKFLKGLKKIFQLFNKPKNVSKLAEGENPQTRNKDIRKYFSNFNLFHNFLPVILQNFFSYLR